MRLATVGPLGARLTVVSEASVRRLIREEMERARQELASALSRDASRAVDASGAAVLALSAYGLPGEVAEVAGAVMEERRVFEVGTAERAALDLAIATAGLLTLTLGALFASGVTAIQLAERMTGARGSPIAAQRQRWRQTADVFAGRAGNATTQAIMERAEALRREREDARTGGRRGRVTGATMHKRDFEIYDPKRNHPISRVLDGQIVPVQSLFRASVAEVERWALTLRKSAGGIFWRQEGGAYVGMTLPAHFGERGIVLPWLPSWTS